MRFLPVNLIRMGVSQIAPHLTQVHLAQATQILARGANGVRRGFKDYVLSNFWREALAKWGISSNASS